MKARRESRRQEIIVCACSILVCLGIVLVALACQAAVEPPSKIAVALPVAPSGLDRPFVVLVGGEVILSAVPVAADRATLGGPVIAAWTSSDTSIGTALTTCSDDVL